jgi:hypothetical protein
MSDKAQPAGTTIYSILTMAGYIGLAMLSWAFPGKTPPQWIALFGFPELPVPSLVAYCLLLAIFALIWVGYWGLVHCCSNLPKWQKALLVIVLVLCGLASAPALSRDPFLYLSYGQMALIWKVNPYLHIPRHFYHDPIVALNTDWPDMPSPYGPSWLSIIVLLAWISGGNPVIAVSLIRLVSVGAHLTGVALIGRMVERWGSGNKDWATTWVLLNPLLLIESAFNGHSDAPMMALFLFGLWLDSKGHQRWAWVVVAASTLVKYSLLPAVGLYMVYTFRKGGLRLLLSSALVFFVTCGLLFAPYWAGRATFYGLMFETSRYDTLSVPYIVRTLLERFLEITCSHASYLASPLAQFLTLAPVVFLFIAFAFRQKPCFLQFVRQSVLLLVVWAVIGSTHLRQWYFVWPIMLSGLLSLPSVNALALGLSMGASIYYASPVLAHWPLWRAIFALACFAWPGWILMQILLNEWKEKPDKELE